MGKRNPQPFTLLLLDWWAVGPWPSKNFAQLFDISGVKIKASGNVL